MRGNHAKLSYQLHEQGSIPAYAGEPVLRALIGLDWWVYPRVCGGTRPFPPLIKVRGLSPRMRGNRRDVVNYFRDIRSIPAYAGEPQQRRNQY